MSNLQQRVLTALIGASAIISLLIFGGLEGVALFALVVSVGMLIEFSKLFFKLHDARQKTIFLVGFSVLIHFLNYWFAIGVAPQFLGLAPFVLFGVYFLIQAPNLIRFEPEGTARSTELLREHLYEWMALLFGFVYAGWSPMLMVQIRSMPQGHHLLLFTLLVVWSADSFAYFAGRFFGKRKLFELISPKKTVEGAVGGLLGAMAIGLGYMSIFLPDWSIWEGLVMILTVVPASIVGDLLESWIKRAMSVKDSGSILPGHGGFLDRFDGVVLGLPVALFFLWLLY